jgi:hypothetical protein
MESQVTNISRQSSVTAYIWARKKNVLCGYLLVRTTTQENSRNVYTQTDDDVRQCGGLNPQSLTDVIGFSSLTQFISQSPFVEIHSTQFLCE